MFGLVFLAGFAFMIGAIACMIALPFAICLKLKINVFVSVALSLLTVVVVLYLISAKEIGETKRFNALCKANGGRHVNKVVEDVNDVRLIGRFSFFDQRDLGEKYASIEWEQSSEKWCHSKESQPGYGHEFKCSTNSFVARYEVRRATSVDSDHIRAYEQRIVDSNTGEELGHEISYDMESESGQAMGVRDIFLASWHMLSWLVVSRDDSCIDYHHDDFVYEVLRPRI